MLSWSVLTPRYSVANLARWHERDQKQNVNFVQQIDANNLLVRTFERGVEAETLSCGTGVTAAALAAHISKQTTSKKIHIKTHGGNLKVSFLPTEHGYESIVLQGPATPVFNGKWELNQA